MTHVTVDPGLDVASEEDESERESDVVSEAVVDLTLDGSDGYSGFD